MTMFSRRTIPFFAIIFFAFLVFVFSLWDILNDEQWLVRIIALYGILLLLTFLFLVSREKKKSVPKKTVMPLLQWYLCYQEIKSEQQNALHLDLP